MRPHKPPSIHTVLVVLKAKRFRSCFRVFLPSSLLHRFTLPRVSVKATLSTNQRAAALIAAKAQNFNTRRNVAQALASFHRRELIGGPFIGGEFVGA